MTGDAASETKTRVVIVEDHTLLRQSLVKTVEAEDGFEVVGSAGRGDEAIDVIHRCRPDLVLLDISLPGGSGIEVATHLRKTIPSLRILFLTMHEDEAHISRAVELGADGYVLKTASTEELVSAVRAVRAGSSYLSPGVARMILDRAGSRPTGTKLTQRELEILRLLAAGTRPLDVGKELHLSVKTVKNHLTSIYAKLGVESAAQAVAEAYRRGMVSPH